MKKTKDISKSSYNQENQEKQKNQEINEKITQIIKEDLKNLADSKYKEFHSKLCPGTNNILGVRVPILRNYAKELSKRFPNIAYKEIEDEFYEETMLKGMLIGLNARNDLKANIADLKYFIKKINNWAVCDIFVSGLKFIKKNPELYWEFIKEYIKKYKEFEKRFGYVVILSYYITDQYIDEVLNLLVNENSEEYYVYMAVSWALSVCLVKYYDKTLDVMKSSNLNKITYNKALQKACESYRITAEQKQELRLLKK